MRTFDQQTVVAIVELQQMVADYWHELDGNAARNITDYYAEDSMFFAGANYALSGRAGVRKFYDDRAVLVKQEKDGVRTTRHTFTNLRISIEDANHASLSFHNINYSAGGKAPVPDFEGPTMVSDVSWKCRREKDGQWRIVEFRGEPIFIGNEAFSNKVLNKK